MGETGTHTDPQPIIPYPPPPPQFCGGNTPKMPLKRARAATQLAHRPPPTTSVNMPDDQKVHHFHKQSRAGEGIDAPAIGDNSSDRTLTSSYDAVSDNDRCVVKQYLYLPVRNSKDTAADFSSLKYEV